MSEGFKFCLWGIIVFKWVQIFLRGSNIFKYSMLFSVYTGSDDHVRAQNSIYTMF